MQFWTLFMQSRNDDLEIQPFTWAKPCSGLPTELSGQLIEHRTVEDWSLVIMNVTVTYLSCWSTHKVDVIMAVLESCLSETWKIQTWIAPSWPKSSTGRALHLPHRGLGSNRVQTWIFQVFPRCRALIRAVIKSTFCFKYAAQICDFHIYRKWWKSKHALQRECEVKIPRLRAVTHFGEKQQSRRNTRVARDPDNTRGRCPPGLARRLYYTRLGWHRPRVLSGSRATRVFSLLGCFSPKLLLLQVPAANRSFSNVLTHKKLFLQAQLQ